LGRYFLTISYDGTAYSGWQVQKNAISVQAVLERVLSGLFSQEIRILGSSRTDAGVHALNQVAQMDFEPPDSLEQCVFRMNMALPSDIAVRELRPVRPDAQCRFEAVSRTYQYRISRRKNPFERQFASAWFGPLNLAGMQECCRIILENLDFQAFSKVHTQVNHFECRIELARWFMEEGDVLIFEIKANRFLRGMVRALVGTMLEVGKGKKSLADFESVFKGKNRRLAGENAPANGLCLMEVSYPDNIYLS
jgi:tRNA pseudouridine38-40 synthase